METQQLRVGNIPKFVEAVGAWVSGQGSVEQIAQFLGVKRDWLWPILTQTGLMDCSFRPAANVAGQDVINVILLYYVSCLMQRTRYVGEKP